MNHTPAYHLGKILPSLAAGDVIYIEPDQHAATMLASRAGVKVRTEYVLVIENYKNTPTVRRLTKITVL